MDPNNDKTTALSMPQPSAAAHVPASSQEQFPVPPPIGSAPAIQSQQQGAQAASQPQAPSVHPVASWLPPTVPLQPTQPAAASQPAQDPAGSNDTVAADALSTAEDGELIEKAWVVRAKQIVAETRQDPFDQARELHKFRADYMKKRYNKDIKLMDE